MKLSENEATSLIHVLLQHYQRHVVPVLTHNVIVDMPFVTVLIKRYNTDLRVLSLMGPIVEVHKLLAAIRRYASAPEIPDPTNYRTIDPRISIGFDVQELGEEELELYRRYYRG